ncbi:MAG: B12-binding domain-containing radical SAM protein [Ferruginibacter sp.]
MSTTVLLITPPFTQLNTPYPATAYLKGFLKTKKIESVQADLGIEVMLSLFSKGNLKKIFNEVSAQKELSINAFRIKSLKEDYIRLIEPVILFLQGKNPTFAHRVINRDYLPEASRFAQLDDLTWAFGNMGIQDKAKHLSTMFLEDLSDFIVECIDPHFGFSRYAERLGRSASSFDELYDALAQPYSLIDQLLIDILEKRVRDIKPALIALSVPFPGNLYTSLRCGQWIKKNYPDIKVAMGGGFANTELRSVSDPRVFEFYDFITLDDGESPLENIIGFISGNKTIDHLKRTFVLINGIVVYKNNEVIKDYRQGEIGTPDYGDLLLDKYISAIEVINPMHRMWSDGRWNKLTMAHGCYWGKCTFCDISLDYIRSYEPVTAELLCNRMEEIMKQTGESGFHFVDEAAPPALMRALALEIIRRALAVTWWANIRFEKSFTYDLCMLLKASGCVAVSGGLEVASDRLLLLIQKGITVSQVAKVNRNFTAAGIMVHAYLMYGFPTQTAQETIDSLEMVRQLFKNGVLQSAFWHRFAMTAHSPVGLEPERFNVLKETTVIGTFANNDILHTDPTGADHELYSFGLKKSLLNYMHNIGLDEPLQKWFEHKVPKTMITTDYILKELNDTDLPIYNDNTKIVWLGIKPFTEYIVQSKKGNQREMASMSFTNKKDNIQMLIPKAQGTWLIKILDVISVFNEKVFTLKEIKENYEKEGLEDFELFWDNKPINTMNRMGLLRI